MKVMKATKARRARKQQLIVPATFAGRKAWEHQAWHTVQRTFSKHGIAFVPLCLSRSQTFSAAEPFLSHLSSPPTALLLTCLPDALAVAPKPASPYTRAWLIELKSTVRDTFALRARDFAAMWLWQAVLVVVHLPTQQAFASPIEDLPAPLRLFIPSPQISPFDAAGLKLLRQRFPDVQVIEGIRVAAGSKAPFALWRLCDLQPLETLIGGERK